MKNGMRVFAMGLAIFALASCSKKEVLENSNNETVTAASRKGGQAAITTYGGSATALNATITTIQNGSVVSNQTLSANTGLLAATGGSLSASEAQANIQNVITAENLLASISGLENQTTAQSSLTSFSLNVNGNVITASTASATANAVCAGTSGSSTVTDLVLNGTIINVTGAPNQVVFLQGGGFIMINEQTTSKKGNVKSITVTALRIVVPNAADVRLASVRADVKC